LFGRKGSLDARAAPASAALSEPQPPTRRPARFE
jgi:hypothetical protein